MRITFLGHQGWHCENSGRNFLLDPILEYIGNGASKLPIWPRRPLEAVIISHEHADHFSLETLAALPRRCTIYISDLSSLAMTTAIAELGFRVERFSALKSFAIAGVRITPLPGLYNTLEPDTYALLMQDASGASFLTAIDTIPHPDLFAWLAANCPQRTLDNLTNNFVEPRQPLVHDSSAFAKSRGIVAGAAIEFVQKFAPRRAVISGQGWGFDGAHADLDRSFFSVDNHWLTGAARELAPNVAWYEGTLGLRFTLLGMECTVDRAPTMSASGSVCRVFDVNAVRRDEPFPAWSGIAELPLDRVKTVQSFIVERLGQLIGAYAPKLMERLYYLKFYETREIEPTLAISLRNGNMRRAFELDFGHLVFREPPTSKTRPPAVGFEMWASDLELLIGAEEEVFLIFESAVRLWSYVPSIIEEQSLIEAFMGFTPRFRPREYLDFYRARVRALELTAKGMGLGPRG
jgi:hypothetical protein